MSRYDYLDNLFSRYIRRRDRFCVRCGQPAEFSQNGELILGLETMHLVKRDNWTTRVDPENADAGCPPCHKYWTANEEEHKEWKREQLGEERYEALWKRGRSIKKRDIPAAIKYVRGLLKELEHG